MKNYLLCAIITGAIFSATPALAEPLGNTDVIQLSQAGLSDEIIVAKIQSSDGKFDLSTDGLIALKKNGVSAVVIGAMFGGRNSSPAGNQVLAASDSPDPKIQRPSGIYLLRDWDAPQKMEIIQPQSAGYAKMKNFLGTAVTLGIAKTTLVSEFSGETADAKSVSKRPQFYFYFDTAATSLSTVNQAASTPDDFILMKLAKKKGKREVMVGKGNRFGERGLVKEDGVKFLSEKISEKSYRLVPESDLETGEYGFIISVENGKGGNSAVAYTFSVQ